MFEHLRTIIYAVSHTPIYGEMYIESEWLPVNICINHPRIQCSNDFAELYTDLVLAVTFGDTQRQLPYICGYPQRFTLLLDSTTQANALEEIKSDEANAG